jgi:competence protein ComEC
VSDRQVVLVAAVAALAAWWSPAVPWWLAGAGLALALVRRRPWAVVVAVGLLAACLGARAWQGDRPARAGPFRAEATLVDDPVPVGSAQVAEVRALGHHFEVWAHGRGASVLRDRAAGQHLRVVGQVAPRPAGDEQAARRHVIGLITADQVIPTGDGGPLVVAVNRLRSLLLAGARPLSADQRSLYGGFVLGDVTGQSAVVADDFRGAGLSHLLVVSGENVAFVLAAAGPLLRRLAPTARWATTVGVLVAFAAMTRFEPSVLRATVMAGLAVTA